MSLPVPQGVKKKLEKASSRATQVTQNAHWATKNNMKGLTHFITDIRDCASGEQEKKRVDKEMANIRKNFMEDHKMKGYVKKKYIAKIIYIYMLGYDPDFGYVQAINLLNSDKFTEKQIGYLACSLLLYEEHEMIPLLIQALNDDLTSRSEFAQSLALSVISNIGGKEMAEALSASVIKLLLASTSNSMIKKKAALCLLRLYQRSPDFLTPDPWASRLIKLLTSKNSAVISSLMSLLIGIAAHDKDGYEVVVDKVIELLHQMVCKNDYDREYEYYSVPNPWLVVKFLKFIRFFPPPTDSQVTKNLEESLIAILKNANKASQVKWTPNHKNAINSILFEAIDVIITLDCHRNLLTKTVELLGQFISIEDEAKEPNVKYLGLEAMAHLAKVTDESSSGAIKKHQEVVFSSLRDNDISIVRKALELLYGMCDKSNSEDIVGELLNFLESADFDIREELVLKIAILSEKYAHSDVWYVDTMLKLISLGGESVPEEIWFRVVQRITNNEDVQEYAASTCLKAISTSRVVSESTVKVASYVLGEFGHLIQDNNGSGPAQQFNTLHSKFANCSLSTKALMLSTYIKFVNLWPHLGKDIDEVFTAHRNFVDPEIQQRSCEYLNMRKLNNPDLLNTVLDVMPAFPENMHGAKKVEYDSSKPTHQEDSDEEDEKPMNRKRALSNSPGPSSQPISEQPHSESKSESPPASAAAQPLPQALPLAAPPMQVNVTTLQLAAPTNKEEYITQLFRLLCTTGDGVLFEDEALQIGLKTEYSAGVGRLMLYYGNTTQQPLTSFTTVIPPVSQLNVQVQQIDNSLPPLQQVGQMITVMALAPYQEALTMHLGYTMNGKATTFTVKLPVILTKFVEPAVLPVPEYIKTWKDLTGTPYEHQSVFQSTRPINTPLLASILMIGSKLSVLQGLDPNPNNIVATGIVHVNQQKYLILVRIEASVETNMFRLTVRCSEGQVAAAVKTLLGAQLV